MSAQIIAFTDRLEFKTFLDIQCKGLTGVAPVVKDNTDEFLAFLNLLSEIEILIIDQPKTKNDYSFLLKAVLEKEADIKNVILVSDDDLKTKKSLVIPQNEVNKLMDHLKSLLETDQVVSDEYISVPTDSFLHFKMLPFDLFIKISEGKYIKRIPANEDIDEETVKALKSKGVVELYFGKRYNRDFSMLLLNNMINKVERNYDSDDEKLKAKSQVFVTTQEIVQSVGLPPRVIEVCESVMESISLDVLKGKDKLSNYLSHIKDSQLSFNFRFVELTSYVAVQMVEVQNSATKEEDIKKIVFAAFFSDISLSDPAHLELRSMDDIKDLWAEDQKVVLEHAEKSASVVLKYKNAPAGADLLIKQHHGTLTGTGLGPISDQIHPLSKCLIAAQEIAFALLKNPGKSPLEVLNHLSKRFEKTPIHSSLTLFKESCIDQL